MLKRLVRSCVKGVGRQMYLNEARKKMSSCKMYSNVATVYARYYLRVVPTLSGFNSRVITLRRIQEQCTFAMNVLLR